MIRRAEGRVIDPLTDDAEHALLIVQIAGGRSSGTRQRKLDHPRLEAIARAGDVVSFPADSNLPDPYDGLLPDHDDFRVHACVGLPLFSDQALIGALTIDGMNPTQFDGISDEELRLPPPSATPCCWNGSPARAANPSPPALASPR